MDTRMEDTMVYQIERNLSNNMNDNLFQAGRAVENSRALAGDGNLYIKADESEKTKASEDEKNDYPLVSNEYINNTSGISRAEYIRQAREACLRQLSSVQIYSKPYEVNYMDAETAPNDQLNQKKANVMNLFRNEDVKEKENEDKKVKDNTGQEMSTFRSIMLRSVCAIVLFISIFLIDKFDVQIGNFTHKTIQEYVTGNDALKQIENFIVTWLK